MDDAPSKPNKHRQVLFGLALVVCALGLITVRVVSAGEAELVASTEALDKGDAHEATVRARRAAGWYAPGAPHVGAAYQRLFALAQQAEKHRRIDIALLAWRGVRNAALQTRVGQGDWGLVVHAKELARANREIARLIASGRHSTSKPDAKVMREQLQALSKHEVPRTPWVIALIVAFATWIGGLLLWARQAARPAGRVEWLSGRGGLALTVLGVVVWLVAVWQA